MTKLKRLVQDGKVEPVASPYNHIMLANIPREVGLHALKHSRDVWERYTGVCPVIGWNPECGWVDYILDIYHQAGFEALVMDADSLLLSFPEIREATGLHYDVQGHSNKNQLFKIEEYIQDKPEFLKYITNPSVASNGLKLIFRSDCMANLLLWYLMGATEGVRKTPVSLNEVHEMFGRWKERAAQTGSFIMPYAEDAEYIGSSAYFYVKQFNEARFFEPEPDSIVRFQEIVEAALNAGYELATPGDVLKQGQAFPNEAVENIENGVAWHGGTAKAWANTEYSRIMDPVCLSLLNGILDVSKHLGQDPWALTGELEQAMESLTNAWVSDSRWPPKPTSPGRFNVRESLDSMYRANRFLREAMIKGNIEKRKGLYSPDLMDTEIQLIDQTLMGKHYFEEN